MRSCIMTALGDLQVAKPWHIPSTGSSLRACRIFNARRRGSIQSSSPPDSKSSAPRSNERLRSRAAYDAYGSLPMVKLVACDDDDAITAESLAVCRLSGALKASRRARAVALASTYILHQLTHSTASPDTPDATRQRARVHAA